jgi:hypothetical protein
MEEDKQQTSSILTEIQTSNTTIEQEAISLPLHKKLRELTDEIEKQQKLIKTLELELKVYNFLTRKFTIFIGKEFPEIRRF